MTTRIAALVDDVFFLAKIRETAKLVGAAVISVDLQCGPAAMSESKPDVILLDLNIRSISPLEWIQELKSDPKTSAIRIVGFISHVQEQLILDARAAGCDQVMARSAFIRQLPELMRNLVASTDGH